MVACMCLQDSAATAHHCVLHDAAPFAATLNLLQLRLFLTIEQGEAEKFII